MALAYTAPTWRDGSGEGISASNLQAISNCIEGLVQGSDKAVTNISMNASVITLTFADGTQEFVSFTGLKGISSIEKTGTVGLEDTYTITYTDGTTSSFVITNGADGSYPDITATASADATSSATPTVTVTKTGTDDAPNFDFAFSGLKGAQGEQGETGATGQGVPTGGSTGQVLKKVSGTDYDTEWANESGGGGSTVTIDHNGTASASTYRVQRIGIDGVYTNIDGTKYMETTTYSDSGDVRTFTFTNADITTDSYIDPCCDVRGVSPTDEVIASGTYTIKFNVSDGVTKVRIYIR